ncbi:MAG: GNAT family N-acetyltransferase [Parachlamydiaceae bacterium]|nr:GNAT family N-acetyltransferase [Parachlamydiaceae bacterium]
MKSTYNITQNPLSLEVKKMISQGFVEHAICQTGMDGLSDDSISFEIFDDSSFVGSVVVQLFWGQLQIKYLFVDKKYRGKGIARHLMHQALEFGKVRGCQFAFLETMSFQALELYQKLGFVVDFTRPGYAKNTSIHYLKKTLEGSAVSRKLARTGVYGVATENEKMLLIKQDHGPYAGRFDFPGGGIEFGETPEEALRREFVEEVAMSFDSITFLSNLIATIEVSARKEKSAYTFFQIGMIYQVEGFRPLKNEQEAEFQLCWVDVKDLTEKECSGLLWKFISSSF